MSDSSEEEDLSRFREAVDSSFTKLIIAAKSQPLNGISAEGKIVFIAEALTFTRLPLLMNYNYIWTSGIDAYYCFH